MSHGRLGRQLPASALGRAEASASAIARALAVERRSSSCCDEPTASLDVSIQAQIAQRCSNDLQRELGLTYLFISHNLAVVRHMADQVGVMYLGRLVEQAPRRELFSNPRHPYTRMLLDALPDIGMTGRERRAVQGDVPNPLNPPQGCAFHPRCPHADVRCTRERPPLVEMALTPEATLSTRASAAPAEAAPRTVRIACHAVAEGRC